MLLSSLAGGASRSSSPDLECTDPSSRQAERSSWTGNYTAQPSWHIDLEKAEDDDMLHLEDLIESHVYDDTASTTPPAVPSASLKPATLEGLGASMVPTFMASNLLAPSTKGPISITKPAPPPASIPQNQQKDNVVYPPRESCINLPIMLPSIPERGAKSRVETQIRVVMELADSSASSAPFSYNKVGSWKWLRLPPGTSTKKRTRKQGKIDPDPEDTLSLSVSVTCASLPHSRVLSCSGCQAREAKRVAKKIAARVKPARSDSDSPGGTGSLPAKNKHEDTTSIVQFNCAEILDFSTGSTILPLRITCYCRHHREKVGFNVHFTMLDHLGRIIGTGSSRPIMITDDHKTVGQAAKATECPAVSLGMELEWSHVGSSPDGAENRAPSKRKKDASSGVKRRAKPYDSSNKPTRIGYRGTSMSGSASPSVSESALPLTRSSTPATALLVPFTVDAPVPSELPRLQYSSQDSESSLDGIATPPDFSAESPMSSANADNDIASVLSPSMMSMSSPPVVMPAHPHPMPYMFFDPMQATETSIPPPTIHRLIPSSGPTHGGIEVTVLGANFHPSIQLNCVFGDVPASSTQRWSDNALVCVLPPRAAAGVVAVWIEGFQNSQSQSQINSVPTLFTYSDESDRALMELALQVVGLKMTGKIEDAKNVAMRIVGNTGSDGSTSLSGAASTTVMTQTLSTSAARDLHPLLYIQAGEKDNFESLVVNFLAILDTSVDHSAAISIPTPEALCHQTIEGQTLLHLAAFLGFEALLAFLVKHSVDLGVRDRNGFTPLHFAVFSRSKGCARLLLEAGADREIVNSAGKTAEEIADPAFLRDLLLELDEVEHSDNDLEDEEAEWGDGEEDAEDESIQTRWRLPVGRSAHSRSQEGTSRRPTSPLRQNEEKDSAIDGKHAIASFLEMLQKTLAQLPGSPQLPLSHFPQLPHISGMPAWNYLLQLPMIFPVDVNMIPGWSSLLGSDKSGNADDSQTAERLRLVSKAAQEWRATWEKVVAALALPTAAFHQDPPPVYTPRAEDNTSDPASSSNTRRAPVSHTEQHDIDIRAGPSPDIRQPLRRFGYDVPPVTDQEVNSYTYQHRPQPKKHDRMLILFWIPILLISLMWAAHQGIIYVFRAMKTALPLKSILRT